MVKRRAAIPTVDSQLQNESGDPPFDSVPTARLRYVALKAAADCVSHRFAAIRRLLLYISSAERLDILGSGSRGDRTRSGSIRIA